MDEFSGLEIWSIYCDFLSWYGRDPFYLEDDKFEELLIRYVEETK